MKPLSLFEVSKRIPKPEFDKRIVEGFPYHQFKGAMDYFADKCRELDVMGEKVGLKFKYVRMTTPREENAASYIGHRTNGYRLRLDRTNLYMVAAVFEYQGRDITAYTRLMYVERGDRTLLDGKVFFIHPVLIDRGVNINKDSIFLSALSRTSVNFTRLRYNIKVNDFDISASTLYATLHLGKASKSGRAIGANKLTMKPLIFIYLLIQKGLRGAFKDYFGLDVIVEEGSYEHLHKKYPSSKYTIYSSSGNRPHSLAKERWNTPSIHLIFEDVLEEHQEFLNTMALNFFYIYDHFNTMIDIDVIDEPSFWEVIAGHIIFNTNDSNAKLAEMVRNHIERSIDVQLDPSALRLLEMDGIKVNDIYELFAWLITNSNRIFMDRNPASMDNKRLTSLSYTLRPITHNITRLGYSLLNLDEPLDFNRMSKLVTGYITEGLIRNIRKEHGEVASLQCATDNIFLSVTRNIVPQARAQSKKRGSSGLPMYNPENFLHPTIMMYGQICGISKPEPTGRGYINPFAYTDAEGNLSYDFKYIPVVERLGSMIRYDYGFKEEFTNEL